MFRGGSTGDGAGGDIGGGGRQGWNIFFVRTDLLDLIWVKLLE